MNAADLSAPGKAQRPPNDSLWRGFARSVRANAVGELALQGVRIGGMVVLARGLTPADFGVFRALLIIWSFGVIPIEYGLPDALIQRRDLRPRHEATAWWLSVAAAAATAMVLYLAAPVIARTMTIPGTSLYIRWLCFPFFVEGTAMVSSARLRRELRFGAVAAAEVASEVAFLAVAIALLLTPYAHSSLAAGLAARITVYSLALWIADHRFVAAMPTLASARELGRFSLTVWGAALIHNASFNADFVLVGRWLGPSALGFYSMAWDLLRFVPDRLHRVVGRVAFPAFARMRDNQELRDVFMEFFSYMARLVIPVMVLAIVIAPDLIGTVYGPKWIPTVVPLRLLAAGFVLVGLRLGIGPIFYTKDHPSFDIYFHGVRLVAVIAAVTATTSYGLGGVSAAMSAVEGAVSVFGIYLACTLIELPVARLVSASLIGVWLAMLCGALAIAFRAMGLMLGIAGIPMLALELTPAVIAFAYSQAEVVKEIVSNAPSRAQQP